MKDKDDNSVSERRRRLLSLLLLISIGLALGYLIGRLDQPEQLEEAREGEADILLAFPDWRQASCVTATSEEREKLETAIKAVEVLGDDAWSIRRGVMEFFSWGLRRKVGEERLPVCIPKGFYSRFADVIDAVSGWNHRFDRLDLRLAARIGEARPRIVEGVAYVAFTQYRMIDDGVYQVSLKPFARTVLASLPSAAEAYAEQAFELIPQPGAMGTGAAQIAVAGGHPEAIGKTVELMRTYLSSAQESEPIPWPTKHRLYELAYALSLATRLDENEVQPVMDLMKRQVESHALQFGLVPLHPKRMCDVLSEFPAPYSKKVADFEYCRDGDYPYDK